MTNWGYTVNRDNQIDFDANSKGIIYKLLAAEPSFGLCIACGSCTGTCTSGKFTDFSLRKVNTLISRGEMKNLSEEIGKCMLCGKCTLVCPRGVNTRNVIINIRRLLN